MLKVTINTEAVKERGISQRFSDFLDANDGLVFSAELENKHKETYVLLEDISSPKWLFWTGDLNILEDLDDEN